jgi:hypothetical protein
MQFGRYAKLLGMLDTIRCECDEFEWKNDNSHQFDMVYFKEMIVGMERQA